MPLPESFLRSGQPKEQTGREGEAGTGMGTSCPLGEPVPFCCKDSVSNWFCPRHFCSRKITIFESNHLTVTPLEL